MQRLHSSPAILSTTSPVIAAVEKILALAKKETHEASLQTELEVIGAWFGRLPSHPTAWLEVYKTSLSSDKATTRRAYLYGALAGRSNRSPSCLTILIDVLVVECSGASSQHLAEPLIAAMEKLVLTPLLPAETAVAANALERMKIDSSGAFESRARSLWLKLQDSSKTAFLTEKFYAKLAADDLSAFADVVTAMLRKSADVDPQSSLVQAALWILLACDQVSVVRKAFNAFSSLFADSPNLHSAFLKGALYRFRMVGVFVSSHNFIINRPCLSFPNPIRAFSTCRWSAVCLIL